ncbi:hypothetical protein BKA70DRAFT_170104 [Coprinopsis sp. MPI-PUGE-AT-0042]|nr:hypothetical protein BKA70DRAFT_170104 [Coprinopsis sp. MPI-PUGE-AT-0042]
MGSGDCFTSYPLPLLETLIIDNEGLLFPLNGFSFPSLRLLGIRGHRLSASDEDLVENDFVKQMLARSSSEPPLLVSLRGTFFKRTLSWLLASLPPSTHLHLDVAGIMREDGNDRHDYVMDTQDEEEEDFDYDLRTAIPVQWGNLEAIHCGRHTIGLWWISDNALGDDIHPLKIYLPQGYGPLSAARRRRGMLRRYGLELDLISKQDHKEKLCSMAPQFSKYSKMWWTF